MMNRSAPADGYDTSPKRMYRRRCWNALTESMHDKPNAQALLMPSIEGDEVDVALSKGLREENLHLVDRNPAIVAHLKRRFPRAHTYGVELRRALARIRRAGVSLNIANIDGCSPVHLNVVGTCTIATANGVFAPKARVAISLLRGRECGLLQQLVTRSVTHVVSEGVFGLSGHIPERLARLRRERDALPRTDQARLALLSDALTGFRMYKTPVGAVFTADGHREIEFDLTAAFWPQMRECFKYKSTAGTQTMLVGVWELVPLTDVPEEIAGRFLRLLAPGHLNGLADPRSTVVDESWD